MPERRPAFRRIDHEVLVANRWHRYCRDRYTRRDGSTGEYYFVEMTGSCGIVPLFDDGTVALVRSERYLLDCDLWEFPIGGMQPGEDALTVAQHELEQEAGLVAAEWTRLGSFAPYKGVSTEICHFFVARELREVGQDIELEESITVHRVPLVRARELLLGQQPADGQSLAGLLLFDRWAAAQGPAAAG
jgi:ADP-ribose pyrophosphatase